jgi:biotin operon repressor
MSVLDSETIVTSLADPTRLSIIRALIEKSHYGEELSHRLGISPSTISFHLKKLESAGLVSRTRDQYYAIYSVKRDVLKLTLEELIGRVPEDGCAGERLGIRKYREKVFAAFFDGGRLVRLPVQKKKRLIVLEEFASLFEPGRDYSECETNDLIGNRYEDYCAIRRELVDEQLLARIGQTYRRSAEIVGRVPSAPMASEEGERNEEAKKVTSTDQKAVLKKLYKENPPSAGIYKITNTSTGKVFLGKGMNVQGKLNGQRAQLKWGSHRNKELQNDWNQYGEDQFAFEVLDLLEQSSNPEQDMEGELLALEDLWLKELQPYGDRGYNEPPRRR